MQDPTDAELISRSLTRPAEFGAIFDRHAEVLLRFLVRRVGAESAAGILGELFRVAFERREVFDPGRPSARPWLYGIATNLLLHRMRSEARRSRGTRAIEDHALALGPTPVTESAIVEEIDARLLLPRVATAVRLLPEGEREALLLFAWEDMPYEQIAEALDIPVGTVRSRIHRARGRLRELIGMSGKDPDEHPDPTTTPEAR